MITPDLPALDVAVVAGTSYATPARARRSFEALAVSEQPQARIETLGASALSDSELLAMLLQGAGMHPAEARAISCRLLAEAGSVAALAGWHQIQFEAFPGVGPTKACQLVAAVELGRRLLSAHNNSTRPLLNSAALIVDHLMPLVLGLEVEKFWVVCCDRKNRLLKRVELTSGTAHNTLAHPREVFRIAVRHSASAIICAHNHPSGDPAPSAPDMHVTRLIREAARTVDIQFIDHVIIGRATDDPTGKGYYSFREAGLI